MPFDTVKYSELIDNFIIDIENFNDVTLTDTPLCCKNLCNFLRIGKINIVVHSSFEILSENADESINFYTSENYDKDRFQTIKENFGENSVVLYKIYQKKNDAEWSNYELKKIRVFQKLIHSFNSKSKILKLIDDLKFKDSGLGIYNLNYFLNKLKRLSEKKELSSYCACYFNLRHFSSINHQIGRKNGTKIMILFIQKLNDMLDVDEVVGRIDGDNFCLLFKKHKTDKIINYLRGTGIVYDDKTENRILLSASAGYYMIPDDTLSVTDITDRVSAALNIAKNTKTVEYIFFDKKLMDKLEYAKKIESMFYKALENEEFQVYFQPKISLNNYQLAGAEALCRWFHNGKILPPDSFIPILEQSKAICFLDFYMLEHTCMNIRKWLDRGLNAVKVSVNLSRRNLGDMDLLDNILRIIDKYSVPHKYIEIELTETAVDVNFDELKKIVLGLQKEGISTSVDDFGMGYSSLSLIRELPWNVLKIDKSFLPEDMSDKKTTQKLIMLKHVVAMAQDIGLECIVEGIETIDQIKFLKENNCFLAQGFYFDKPMPVREFEDKLAKNPSKD